MCSKLLAVSPPSTTGTRLKGVTGGVVIRALGVNDWTDNPNLITKNRYKYEWLQMCAQLSLV